ncbi:MAG TPA: biotin/lipoyl-containing protein, partial [bacterium]|nr:biotin/lipoyl-containing protein [bacterium]
MPKMSDAMTEGRVLSWRKRVGDRVARGDVLAEIETDKVNVEIEAEAAGTLSEILVPDGGRAPVGAVIAQINGRTTTGASPAAPAGRRSPTAKEAPVAADVPPVAAPRSARPLAADDAPVAVDRPPAAAAERVPAGISG